MTFLRSHMFLVIGRERPLQRYSNSEVSHIDKALSDLGFPYPDQPNPPPFTPYDEHFGLLRRSPVFAEFRRQLAPTQITRNQITRLDQLLTDLGFPAEELSDKLNKTPAPSSNTTPTSPTKPISKTRATLIALLGASGLASATLLLDRWEGNELKPYYDIVGVATNCRGNTANVDMTRRYTAQECEIINDEALLKHLTPTLAATPSLRGHPDQLTAATSLAYNVGNGAYAKSSVDRYFDQGSWYRACDAILLYNKAGGKVVRGLTLRRQAERELCRRNVPAQYRK